MVKRFLFGFGALLVLCTPVLQTVTSVPASAAASTGMTGTVNSELPWHAVVLDQQGKLLAWYQPQKNLGYDEVLRLGWNFMEHKIPDQAGTRLKTYLVNSVFNGDTLQGAYWQSNPAMTVGSFVDSAVAWYPYSADRNAVRTVGSMLDYILAHGTTPAKWSWGSVPFPTGCGNQPSYGRCLSDMPMSFYGGIEPDKVGELGIGYERFYELTGNHKYLVAAVHCANALAAHVKAGNDAHTPWPFRVNGKNGATIDGEGYGGIVVSPLRLFDALIRINQGKTAEYKRARRTAWKWLDSHQLNPRSPTYDDWSGYFEDVPRDQNNVNQAAPTYTALYLLNLSDPSALDPLWKGHVEHLIQWVQHRFAVGPFDGATGINEQGIAHEGGDLCCSTAGLGSDTARWAAINALYYERTGEVQAGLNSFRSLNYATYFADSDGRVSCCGQSLGTFQYWFSDGYSDYLRSFNWVMAAIPQLAPDGQNHLLASTSVVKMVTYGHDRITYRTFDQNATEVLRLTFRPHKVDAGGQVLSPRRSLRTQGYTLQALGSRAFILRLHHARSGNVLVAS